MSRHRTERVAPVHVYVPGPSLYTRGDSVIVRHVPACRCGWRATVEYADADVARAAWAAHRDEARA
jgi:hypothetical protein